MMAETLEITPGLRRLKDLIDVDKSMSVAKVAAYVQEAAIEEADLLPYADYNHHVNDGYGRKLVVEQEHYEIMVMSWNPGDVSAVHDHGYTSWGAVQVFGHVLHHTFAVKNDVFAITRKEILPNKSIIKVNHPLIHQMGNVTSSPYLTLHIYGSNEHTGNITADARIFELESGLMKHTSGGVFFNLPDESVFDVEQMPESDHQTFVHQAAILIQYYQRYDDEKRDSLCNALLEKLSLVRH